MIGYRIELIAKVSYCAGKEEFFGWRVAQEEDRTPEEVMKVVNATLRALQDDVRGVVTKGPIGRVVETDPETLATALDDFDARRKAAQS